MLNDSAIADTNGGLMNAGVAVIRDSSITSNSGYENGGGIHNHDGGTVSVMNSVISGNGGQFRGGGVFNGIGGSMTLTDSVVSGNRITYEGSGGGIYNYGTLVLVGTTVADNQSQLGGGIANHGHCHDSAQHDFRQSNKIRVLRARWRDP